MQLKEVFTIGALVCSFSGTVESTFSQPIVKPVTDVEVIDTNNKTLGQVFLLPDFGLGESSVVMRVGSQFVLLPFSASGFGEPLDFLVFTTPDCTGEPWILTNNTPTLFARSAIVPPGNTLYISTAGALPEQQNIQSLQRQPNPEFDQHPDGCFEFTGLTTVIRAQSVVNLDEIYTPPFTLRSASAKQKHGKK